MRHGESVAVSRLEQNGKSREERGEGAEPDVGGDEKSRSGQSRSL